MIADNIEKIDDFTAAYEELISKDEIRLAKDIIESYIKEQVEGLVSLEGKPRNLFSTESRIKSVDSFREKVFRKNYISTWKYNSRDELITTINNELPDLIGIRVNCYFRKYEKEIYDELEKKLAEQQPDSLYVFNFHENKKQKNGHTIYKFTGRYNDNYNFEIQIKSVMHNVWGEVEHKTVYKNREYNSLIDRKKTTTNALWDILKASDMQLLDLYNGDVSTEHLLRGLFFNFSKDVVSQIFKTDILANHYKNFFTIFIDNNNVNSEKVVDAIKDYVVQNLISESYEKKELIFDASKGCNYVEIAKSRYNQYNMEFIYLIASILFKFKDYDDFILYLLDIVLPEREEEDGFDDITFMDDEEYEIDNSVTAINDDVISYMDSKLEEVLEHAEN